MCRNCKFWINQNDDLIKINAALGERNRALEKICDELSYGGLAGVLGRLNLDQVQAVKVFAQWLLKEDEEIEEREKRSNLGTNQRTE